MKHETIATIGLLSIIVATGPVGAVPLSLSILATYGLLRTSILRQKLSKGGERATILAFAAVAVPLLAFLVGLWSLKCELSLPVGGAVWFGIIAAIEHGREIAVRWSEHRKTAASLDSSVAVRQAA